MALAEYGVRTIGDLAGLPPDLLVRRFGKHGARWSTAPAAWTPTRSTTATRRSRSATSTRSTSTRATARSSSGRCSAMADGVAGRLRSAGVRAATVTVKIRDIVFRTITRQRTLAEPTDLTEPIFADGARARPAGGPRACASACSASPRRTSASASSWRCSRPTIRAGGAAVEAADALRRRYGERAITRARLVGTGLPAPFERDPRNPLDRRARGVPADPRRGRRRTSGRAVTAQADTDARRIPPDDA